MHAGLVHYHIEATLVHHHMEATLGHRRMDAEDVLMGEEIGVVIELHVVNN